MIYLTLESFLSAEETDEYGKHIAYQDANGYSISVNTWQDASYLVLWYGGRNVGFLVVQPVHHNQQQWQSIRNVDIAVKHRGKGYGYKLYQTLLRHLGSQYAGLLSYLPNRANKRQVPRIHAALGGYLDNGDYLLIPRPATEEK